MSAQNQDPGTLPTPPELFRLFEEGKITRDQLHAAMNGHALFLVEEMIDQRRHPVLAAIDTALTRRAAGRLAKQHGEAVIREALAALARIPGFAPARFLWNAGHWDVPLHCFLRHRREPVFRILEMKALPRLVTLTAEHGAHKNGAREHFVLRRSAIGQLIVGERSSAR